MNAIKNNNFFIILNIFWFNNSKVFHDSEENLKMEKINKNLRIK